MREGGNVECYAPVEGRTTGTRGARVGEPVGERDGERAGERCRLCGAQAARPALVARERMFGTGEPFAYDACGACGSLQLREIPGDLARHYPSGYYAHGPADGPLARLRQTLLLRLLVDAPSAVFAPAAAKGPFAAALATHPIRALRGRLRRAARIADVGGGAGRLLRGLARIGFRDLTVIDPFGTLEGTHEGVRFVRAPLADVPGPFDLIGYHHALEHVPEPALELRRVRERLAPGGLALVRVPWVPSQAFDTYGAEWVQLDAPRHLTVPSRDGLRAAAEAAGLTWLASGDDSTELQFWGSEAYRAGRSLAEAAATPDAARRGTWRREAARLNALGRGDQGWMLLQAPAR